MCPSFQARSFQAPSSIGKIFAPKVLLSYSIARHTYHMHHIRHPHPIWPSAPMSIAPPYPSMDDKMDDTIEHIVPQSIYKTAPKPNRIRCDMHNFFVFPSKLNTRKSNLQYKDFDTYLAARARLQQAAPLMVQGLHPDGASTPLKYVPEHYPLQDYENHEEHDDHLMHILIKSSQDKIIVPPPCLRGLIARTVCYMALVYPDYADAIYKQVLDPFTLLYWHQMYPVTKYEYDRTMFIEFIQGNSNPFVKYPEFLPSVIHVLTLEHSNANG